MLTVAAAPSDACLSSVLVESSGFTILAVERLESPPPLDGAACPRINSEYEISFLLLLAGCLRVES